MNHVQHEPSHELSSPDQARFPSSLTPTPTSASAATSELHELLRYALDCGVTPAELKALVTSGVQPTATCPECRANMEPFAHGLKCVQCGLTAARRLRLSEEG